MRINLLPERYAPEPLVNPLRLTLMIAGSVILFGMIIWLYALDSKLNTEKNLLANANLELDSYQSTMQQVTNYEQKLKTLDVQMQEMDKIKAAYLQYPLLFKELAGALTEDVWFESISMPPLSTFTVTGKSLFFPNIGGLVRNLNHETDLSNVKLTQVSQADQDSANPGAGSVYSFTIKLNAGGGEPTYAQVQKK